MESMYYPYGDAEILYLGQRDERLGEYMRSAGMIRRVVTPDLFASLVQHIVGQQVSGKAAESVLRKVAEASDMTPESIASLPADALRECGMSYRKAGYVKGVAEAVLSGALDLEAVRELPDDEVIRTLTALHGVGVWTAEMMLIFSLLRPDVLSFGDLGIRRGLMKLHRLPALPKEVFRRYRQLYSPHGTVASIYLWQISSDPAVPDPPAPGG